MDFELLSSEKLSFFILMFLICSNLVLAQTSIPNKLKAIRIIDQIDLNGILNEHEWIDAEKIDNFTQRELNEGKIASEKTEVAVLYSNSSIFIGVWCYDSYPEKITATQMKRDFESNMDDNITIILDTYNDSRTGYRFVINPNGARGDAILIDDGRVSNEDWNGVWDCAVEINKLGWFAEIEIPFATLKFPNTQDQLWGFNIERNIRRNNEQIFWQGWDRDNSSVSISNAGILTGIENISTDSPIELKPFLTFGLEDKESKKTNFVSKFGGDILYSFTPTLKLNLTVNTDFAQVESDKAEINLTRFSISYPEKREFFLEGKNFFDFNIGSDINIFYSRRIGIEGKSEIPILGGAKLTGKVGDSDIGFLSIQTSAKDSLPSNNFTVLRFRQDIFEQSSVGIILTAKNSELNHNYVFGFDANYTISNLFGDKNFTSGGLIAQSHNYSQKSGKNIAYQVYLSYPNDFIEYDLSYTNLQDDFSPGIGFLKRRNFKQFSTELQINPRPKFIPWINRAEVKPIDIDLYFTENTNELESAEYEWRPIGFSTQSGDFMEFNIQRSFERLDEDFKIRENNLIKNGEYWFTHYEIQFESYKGRKISTDSKINWGDFFNGYRTMLECEVIWNLNTHVNLSSFFERNIISLPGGKFSTNEIGVKIEYAANPKLYTRFFGQWNNDDDELNLNFHVNWIPKIGSDFYLVVNQNLSGPDLNLKKGDLTVLAKLIWRFTI